MCQALLCIATLQGGHQYPHFTRDEAEDQRGHLNSPRSHSWQMESPDCIPILLDGCLPSLPLFSPLGGVRTPEGGGAHRVYLLPPPHTCFLP